MSTDTKTIKGLSSAYMAANYLQSMGYQVMVVGCGFDWEMYASGAKAGECSVNYVRFWS